MESGEKTFHHSFGKLALMFLGVLFLVYAAFGLGRVDYFIATMAALAFVVVLFYATSRVKISNEEITTSRLLSSKSLRWTEIARASTRGQALRLHDHDEDVILSIDPQLDGYKEILDVIFNKRPDIFDEGENSVMSANWLGSLLLLGFSVLLIAGSVTLFFVSGEFERIYSILFLALGVYLIVSWFLSPKSMALKGRTLLLKYFFREVSYPAEDIDSVSFEKRRTKNGYIYFAQLNLKSGKRIKLPTFKQGGALTYQVLRRWLERATRVHS